MEPVKDKLFRYLSINTIADPDSTTTPSNSNIITLGQLLVSELQAFSNTVQVDEYTANGGYFVCAKILSNQSVKDIPVIGFVAHMDTSYRYPGTAVPLVVNSINTLKMNYGIDIKDAAYTEQDLKDWIAEGIVVSSAPFTTLGVKDKAGIAEIMSMIEYLDENPSIPHGQINICFVCDAELGKGVDHIEDQGTVVQATDSGGNPLWRDPSTGNVTNVFTPGIGLEPVERLDGGFMDADLAYLVDSRGETSVQYNNFNVSEITVKFKGERIMTSYDEGASINAIKNACLFVNEVINSDPALTIDIGSGYAFIKSLNGDYLNAELLIRVQDLDKNNVNDMIERIINILQRMYFYNPTYISYSTKDIYSNVRNSIPLSMIRLAIQGVYDVYVRGCMTTPISNGYTAAGLTIKGVPTVSISCGGYNYFTYSECIPIPALDHCRDTLIKIVEESFSFDFGTDFD